MCALIHGLSPFYALKVGLWPQDIIMSGCFTPLTTPCWLWKRIHNSSYKLIFASQYKENTKKKHMYISDMGAILPQWILLTLNNLVTVVCFVFTSVKLIWITVDTPRNKAVLRGIHASWDQFNSSGDLVLGGGGGYGHYMKLTADITSSQHCARFTHANGLSSGVGSLWPHRPLRRSEHHPQVKSRGLTWTT